jgi:hypothetical protein
METVKSGLGLYANIKTYGMIFFGVLLLCSAIAFLIKVINANYQKSPKSKIGYYFINEDNECLPNDISNNLCQLKVQYTDGMTVYKEHVDQKSQVGDTTVFYEQKNPKSYMIAPTPYLFPGMFSCFASIILIFAIIRLTIIKSSKDGAALIGTMDIVSDTMSRLNKK